MLMSAATRQTLTGEPKAKVDLAIAGGKVVFER